MLEAYHSPSPPSVCIPVSNISLNQEPKQQLGRVVQVLAGGRTQKGLQSNFSLFPEGVGDSDKSVSTS